MIYFNLFFKWLSQYQKTIIIKLILDFTKNDFIVWLRFKGKRPKLKNIKKSKPFCFNKRCLRVFPSSFMFCFCHQIFWILFFSFDVLLIICWEIVLNCFYIVTIASSNCANARIVINFAKILYEFCYYSKSLE